jgi:hypothetical protein
MSLRVIEKTYHKRRLAAPLCAWSLPLGTDWTRTIGMLTHEQGVAPLGDTKRLSESDKAALMGGTLRKVYKWQRDAGDPAAMCNQERDR